MVEALPPCYIMVGGYKSLVHCLKQQGWGKTSN